MLPKVTFLGHATVLIEIAGVRVLTDPILLGRVAFLGRVTINLSPSLYEDVDVVLISHMHHDHCDLRSLRKLGDLKMVVPDGAGPYLRRKRFHNVVELPVGKSHHVGDVQITAMPAVHDGHRAPFGPRAEAVGYMISSGEANVYFAGDTDVFPGMAGFPDLDSGEIDVALLPIWGWGPTLGPGHMNPSRAVDAVELLLPRYAIPIHWGTLFPYGLRLVRPSFKALLEEPPREFAKLARNRDVKAEILVVDPGNPVVFTP